MPLKKGFTLIELLFVIALIGVITAFSISTYQKKAENTKIDKAALQIQQILQAASIYYTDQQHWPNANDLDFKNYLPFNQENIVSPWGATYIYQPQDGGFEVSLTTPNNHIAQRIAIKLPFAQTNKNNVVTQISLPGQQISSTGHYIIQKMGSTGFLNLGNPFTISFTCPHNWTGGVQTSPDQIKMRDDKGVGSVIISQLKTWNTCHLTNPMNYLCQIYGTVLTKTVPKDTRSKISVNYIAYCTKP